MIRLVLALALALVAIAAPAAEISHSVEVQITILPPLEPEPEPDLVLDFELHAGQVLKFFPFIGVARVPEGHCPAIVELPEPLHGQLSIAADQPPGWLTYRAPDYPAREVLRLVLSAEPC